MQDLISRQAAIEALNGEIEITGRTNAEAVKGYVRLVKDRLERLPSAQPEITRCKDCIYFTPEKSGEHWNVCRFYDAPKTADGYCNDAERKEE